MINSIFSMLSGMTLMMISKPLKKLFEVEEAMPFLVVGAVLLTFGSLIYVITLRYLYVKWLVNIISFLDFSWVLGSILFVAIDPYNISIIGAVCIVLVAVWVGFLGFKQYKWNR
ncbi:MAG: hypothetical protein ACI8ZN_002212 [Bacteroidia bacterium]|jgi:hypothetical protein